MNYPVDIHVYVSQDDIDKGRCGNVSECAVARAIARIFPGRDVMVGSPRAYIMSDRIVDTIEASYFLPEEAQRFIADFDTDKSEVKPINFRAVLVVEVGDNSVKTESV